MIHLRLILVTVLALSADASAQTLPSGGTASTAARRADSRMPFVHRIGLMDENGKPVQPNSPLAEPYSPVQTCAACHDTAMISHGWHFDARERREVGRPGEPWIFIDGTTRTQVPLSYRGTPGTFKPADFGINEWRFVELFGRHLPGGVPGNVADDPAAKPAPRWKVSGKLEIDCMMCHSADNSYDYVARAQQIRSQNYRWVPTVALGLGVVHGDPASDLEPDYDRTAIKNADDAQGPRLKYEKHKFDGEGRVVFNVTRRPSAERCYACHTVNHVGTAAPRWQADRDVHLSAGLSCIDCHRNGIDHQVVRGFEEPTLTCAGCHSEGRMKAPRPQHKGFPPIHFEKLTCTACHSGAQPRMELSAMQTALAHGLGLESSQRKPTTPPLIAEPIFLRNASGKIAPHRAVWPSYWGVADQSGKITPLPMDVVKSAASGILPAVSNIESSPMPPLSNEQINKVLAKLKEQTKGGTPVFVAEGHVHGTAGNGEVPSQPYAWPVAHDVRPAAKALGAGGCTDCHSETAPLVFGNVTPKGLAHIPAAARQMHQLRGEDAGLWKAWALSFQGRTVFVAVTSLAGIVVAGVVVLYGFKAMAFVARRGRD